MSLRLTRAEIVTAGSATLVSLALGGVLWGELLTGAAPPPAISSQRAHSSVHAGIRARVSHRPARRSAQVVIVAYRGLQPTPSTNPEPRQSSPAPQPTTTPPRPTRSPAPAPSPTSSPAPNPTPSPTAPKVSTSPVCVTVLGVTTCLPTGVTP